MKSIRDYINLIERQEQILSEAVNVNSKEFKAWFRDSKVVDSDGKPLPVYHGTQRPDRVGTIFRRSRATAGPMAYFTEDPEIASGYATGKPDTSYEGEDDYANWFLVKIPGYRSKVNISRSWYYLNQQQKNRIAELAPKISRNDFGDDIIFNEENTDGPGGLSYAVKQKRGNYLDALVEQWLKGGILFNDEIEFIRLLKMVDFPYYVEFNNPHATYSAVYAVYLSIQNPLDTNNIPQRVVDALYKASRKIRNPPFDYIRNYSKKGYDARLWMEELINSIKDPKNQHWTVVPDWVTKTLKSFGYDGIKEGHHGNGSHIVWIPFTETQVKSAISNTNFNPNKKNIHH